jgi:hypothetical protein
VDCFQAHGQAEYRLEAVTNVERFLWGKKKFVLDELQTSFRKYGKISVIAVVLIITRELLRTAKAEMSTTNVI